MTDNLVLLDKIAFAADLAVLRSQLHMRPGRSDPEELLALVAEAQAIARPKVLYKIAFVEETGGDHVVLDGIRLKSRVMAVNLAGTHRVFAFVATSGVEIEEWLNRPRDLLQSYWAEQIAENTVHAAMSHLTQHLTGVFGVSGLSAMNPGSLPDWPISEQRPLFQIVGDTEASIGVRLTPSLLMVPRKSVSGILFPAAEGFASCQLCPRDGCPNRRAPYDRELLARKYQAAA